MSFGRRVGDSKRSGARTHESALRTKGEGGGERRGVGGLGERVAVGGGSLGPWGAGIDLLGPPSPPGISPRPR